MNFNILYNIGEYISSCDVYVDYLFAIFNDENLIFAIDNWIIPKYNIGKCNDDYYICMINESDNAIIENHLCMAVRVDSESTLVNDIPFVWVLDSVVDSALFHERQYGIPPCKLVLFQPRRW